MFENKKLLWIIGAGAIIVALLVTIIAWKLGKKNAVVMPAGLTQVTATANRPIGLVVNDKGEALYFDGVKKTFYKNKDAISKALEIEITNNAVQVKWSDDLQTAILRTGGKVFVYSFADKKLTPLPLTVKDADFFGPDKLLTLVINGPEKYLFQTNYTAIGGAKLMDLSFAAGNLVISPDKKTAIIGSAGIYQPINLTTAKPIAKLTSAQIKDLQFSPDSASFAFVNLSGNLIIMGAKNNQKITNLANFKTTAFTWTSVGSVAIASDNQGSSDITLVQLKPKFGFKVIARGGSGRQVIDLLAKNNLLYLSTQQAIFSLNLK